MYAHPGIAIRQHPASAHLVLIGDSTTSSLIREVLTSRGHSVILRSFETSISHELRTLSTVDIVLIDLTNVGDSVMDILKRLNAAIGIANLRPRLICFSTAHRNPRFQLAIEKNGARYVRVTDFDVLLEAIDVVLEETKDLERGGLCFEIVHSFCQSGTCAPGEQVTAVLLTLEGRSFQLRLGLAQRLVFDFLASHRRLALDSLQIVSGLGGWFYKEHASNSGHKQVKKIRRATAKVLVQRIRGAMGAAFAEAHLRFDPHDVLRSCDAEGSKRVLYKLHADVRWQHVNAASR